MSVEISRKILFVDDEQNILDGFNRRFRKKFEIETALGGKKALDLMNRCGPFAVVVSDLRMADIDGLTLLRQVQKLSPETVCVMLTGFADLDVAVEAVNEGRIFRFLNKPCPHEVLLETLNEGLGHYKRQMSVSTYTYTTHVKNSEPASTQRSHGCLAVTGYSQQDFLNDSSLWLAIVMPEHRQMVTENIERVIAGDEIGPIEFKIQAPNGDIRWIRDTIIPHRDKNDIVCKFDGLVENITESRQIAEALQKSEARYHRMVANIPGIVYQFALQTNGTIRFSFLSDSCADILGLDPKQVKNDSTVLLDKIYPEDLAEFYRLIDDSAEKLTPCDWWGRVTVDGRQRWLQSVSRPERIESGNTIWDGIILDMTEYRRIEGEVRSLAKFPDENPNPVMRMTDDGEIIYANKATEPLLNLWGTKVGQKAPEDLYELALSVKASGSYDCLEVTCSDRIFSIVFAPFEKADYINLYARDITEVKQAEDKLIKTNEMLKEHDRLKNEFVSTVSHELRTPLCVFKNIVSNAMAGVMGKVSPKLYESLKTADQSIDRLSRIVADFLDISRIESGVMKLSLQSVAIQPVISNVAESLRALARDKGLELNTQMCSEDIFVNADRDRIVQVLTNLIGNAIKFIPTGSQIDVIVTDRSDHIEVAVRDNGPGLSKEDIEKIFDRFVQTRSSRGAGHHGTGLGLTIAKELIEMHQGKIWVESKPGYGCSFFFTLPKYDQSADSSIETEQLVSTGSSANGK
ncbi:MAG: ATP-binding protein [Planctomycetota bacterium]|jgi:PAS domain S-box-containing protein